MEHRISFKTYLTVIMMVVLTNCSLFFFLYQASRYDSTVASVRKNEQILAELENENRALVANALMTHSDNEKHVATLMYKNEVSDV